MRTGQRLIGAVVHRDLRPAKFNRIKRVTRGLLDVHIASHGSDRNHAHVGRAQNHDERDGVIGGNVGIDQKGTRHRRMIANECLSGSAVYNASASA
jgi:hypothetical protein